MEYTPGKLPVLRFKKYTTKGANLMQNLLTVNKKSRKKFRCPIDMSAKNNSQTILFTLVKNLSTVLDVGCASGEMGIALDKMKSCKVYGIDNSIRHIAAARNSGSYEEVFNMGISGFLFAFSNKS